jgi:hypothetical protein
MHNIVIIEEMLDKAAKTVAEGGACCSIWLAETMQMF